MTLNKSILLMVQKSSDHHLRLVFYLIINRVLAPSFRWWWSPDFFQTWQLQGRKWRLLHSVWAGWTDLLFTNAEELIRIRCKIVDVKLWLFKYFKIFHSFTESTSALCIFGTKLAGRMEFPTFPLRMTMSFSQKHLKRIFIKAWHVQLSKESSMVALASFLIQQVVDQPAGSLEQWKKTLVAKGFFLG